jgi:hypothetical protein
MTGLVAAVKWAPTHQSTSAVSTSATTRGTSTGFEKHIPGTRRLCFLVERAAVKRGDEHRHHERLRSLAVPAKGGAIHAWGVEYGLTRARQLGSSRLRITAWNLQDNFVVFVTDRSG